MQIVRHFSFLSSCSQSGVQKNYLGILTVTKYSNINYVKPYSQNVICWPMLLIINEKSIFPQDMSICYLR
jgi:hypothetical protein